jgi:hypothetical protein
MAFSLVAILADPGRISRTFRWAGPDNPERLNVIATMPNLGRGVKRIWLGIQEKLLKLVREKRCDGCNRLQRRDKHHRASGKQWICRQLDTIRLGVSG